MLEVFGDRDSVLRRVEDLVECEIVVRGNEIVLRGTERAVEKAEAVFNGLVGLAEDGHHPTPETAERLYKMGTGGGREVLGDVILTHPAVEAGESLGFLPGDMMAKVDPYFRPLYDALYEMVDPAKFQAHLERGIIEIAPLAFMRGRAQPLRTEVPTPLGWRALGSLEEGDWVIGSNGQPTQVLGVYPQGRKEVFRVTMSDGSSTVACAEHLWAVRTASDKRKNRPARILETREMMGQLRAAHQYRYELPLLSAPVEFPARVTPLDPYALGLLIGDG